MIGRTDVIFENPGFDRWQLLDAIARCVCRHWRRSILQDGKTGKRYASYTETPFKDIEELLIYRDQAAFESWERLGADPENANAMIHLLVGENDLALVVDDENEATMRSVLEETKQLLSGGMPRGALEAA